MLDSTKQLLEGARKDICNAVDALTEVIRDEKSSATKDHSTIGSLQHFLSELESFLSTGEQGVGFESFVNRANSWLTKKEESEEAALRS